MRLPRAYRSLPRPSSPSRAKASTVRLLSLDLKMRLTTTTRVCLGVIPRITTSPSSVVKEQRGPRGAARRSNRDEEEPRAGDTRGLSARRAEHWAGRRLTRRSRKEVIQPQVPLRLPCYDFAPVTDLTFDGCALAVRPPASGPPSFHGVTGGVYKARERIHRGMADPRLLAIPTSRSRVADSDPHLDRLLAIGSLSRVCDALYRPL